MFKNNFFLLDLDLNINNISLTNSLLKFKKIYSNNEKYYYIGDAININKNIDFRKSNSFEKILLNTIGHFYLICLKNNSLYISSSLFSNLPLFYFLNSNRIIISSDLEKLAEKIRNSVKINEKFILQTLLFNYTLFNDTIFQEIKLCPANTYIKISSGKVSFIKYFEVDSLYVDDPRSDENTADELADLFIKRYKEYIPENNSYISLTGGFDGRTLVSCAKYYNQDFAAFSFGKQGFKDIDIPVQISKKLNIPYEPIYLDKNSYIEDAFLSKGKHLINISGAISNFLYVHFLYSAELLSRKSNYLFAGYFGSELFRTLHLTGAIISKELFRYFGETNKMLWIDNIKNSFKLKYLNEKIVSRYLEEIISELDEYKSRISMKANSLTKMLYIFILEEIFRKVFGSHIFSQSHYINVRTPFLDLAFIKELFKTDYAGVNNEFFTNNPLRRLKGQYLYVKILDKTYKELLFEKVDKGYLPNHILNKPERIKIIFPYLRKKISRKIVREDLDNLSIISGLNFNKTKLLKKINDSEVFNYNLICRLFNNLKSTNEEERDILALAASISIIINK